MIAFLLLTSLSFNAFCANVTVKNSEQNVKKTIPKVKYVGDYKGTPTSLTGEHIVQKGETLFGIAKYYQMDHKEILALNNLTVENGVKVGQKLKIPQKKTEIKDKKTTNEVTKKSEKKAEDKTTNPIKNHIVMQGETLFGIARNYGINPLDLATENNIDLSYMVKVGQKLKIPQTEENEKPKENKPMPSVQNIAKEKTEEEIPSKQIVKESGCKLNFLWPSHSRTIANKFGSNTQNGAKIDGIIIATEKGNNVFASYGGTVAYAGTDISEYGKLMIVKHTDNWLTIYGYLDSFEKSVGQTVKAGDVIGKSGQTGEASEPSIYFSIRHTKKPYNPEVCL